MVLPLLIGIGVTAVAVGARSGLRAWMAYKQLTPVMIARLNGIHIDESSYWARFHGDRRFNSNRVRPPLKKALEQEALGGFFQRMSESEALLILNISPGEIAHIDERLVKQRHRAAILRNHPDKGGSPFITAKINEAREVILASVLVKRR